MKHSKIPLSQTVVTLCKAHNVKHIVISPGSRNAPLTIGFTHDDFFNCYSIVDERCAAFFALGIAQQLQEAVAIVCTSGSALLNYYPAVAEAFYSNIPIVVLSADRPKHLVGIGDGQTIKQKNVYGDHVLYSTNLKLDLKEEDSRSKEDELPIFKNLENKLERILGLQKDIQSFNESEIHNALTISNLKLGPTHINIPFDEPLYETVEKLTVNPKIFKIESRTEKVDDFEIKSLLDVWHNAKRKMILVGVLQPNSIEEKWIQEIADDDSILVFTETTSNLHHQDFFPEIDKIIAPLEGEELKTLQPDILLTFGGLIVSKKIKKFLRKYKPDHHWHVSLQHANDTFFCLEKHIKLRPNTFLSAFLPQVTHHTKSNYKTTWLATRQLRRKKHKAYLKVIPFSDFTVFNSIIKSLPIQGQLQISNSSAIRYTQLFQMPKHINIFCNRGTSGIDGSTSTAIGAAVAANEPTTFITGDLSFFYDSNALWNNYIPKDFRIIVVNNNGGGIFRILPGHKDTDNFNTFFETKHQLTAKQLCNMYGFDYLRADDETVLKSQLEGFYNASNQPKLLEIFTPSTLNDKILLDYFEFIK
ncbi:2-succinyl-5-enolpyruvyl-6-hydroxy-3-cyclohexene-1-carboxylic-acid synthase [Winogradskyella echinorum]|uniref:2-succinyl-5-enolpyruvyl-6-hydroxy-3-cyclohexene-1-carboxylate synthase n=1 Tax=Winogradskyella echinorum TaxID=538189 RepID=A0ABR6Y1H5_9FLAO|nr:2-succinyl-5-enolpyruvyl-6-hydroxy-3-cyclohexene-1-carboxylic-acid synthase [Winogradskyella echinorum]MBC3846591.1 2-succinyl-5-enolpyruvyl-6-hydroxy-3-cyclohexene-1-carboxylic-acid synthase [Winogradskyella echinorum]MBC5750939.1 2-succinyl-5-enolpyruvyl-6-hydroxy-3-cyclohexene-1-carboxylic-acid synthase [Winogradskyella echinorum]